MYSVTTITHKTSDTKAPLIMLTNREGYKYLIGKVPEGTQRVLNENRIRLTKLRGILFTGTISTWSDIGGLPGLFLTISDSTKNSVDFFSGCGKLASYAVATWRYFVFRKGVQLRIRGPENGLLADSNVVIKPLIVNSRNRTAQNNSSSEMIYRQIKKLTSLMFPLDTSKVNDKHPDSFKSDPSETDIHTHVKLPDVEDLEPYNERTSTSYLIRLLPVRGKFDPAKAKSLGLLPGNDFRKLTEGESVTTVNGRVVTSDEVLGETKSFSKILVLDIPNMDYYQNTIESDIFNESQSMGPEEIGIVYHFIGDSIDFDVEHYFDFIKKFPAECKHVISHNSISNNTLVFRTSAINTLKLKSIDNDSYKLPFSEPYIALEEKGFSKLQSLQQFHISSDGIIKDESLISKESWSSCFDANVGSILPEIDKDSILNDNFPVLSSDNDVSVKDNIQVITVGTGSALPSIDRNVVSTIVRVPYEKDNELKFRSIMLDGGENTLGSIMRYFGDKDNIEYKQFLSELSLIFLSHLHADHHLGLLSVISAWFSQNNNNNKLFIVGPWQYNVFLNEWYKIDRESFESEDLSRIIYLSCEEFLKDRQPEFEQISLEEFEKVFSNNNGSFIVPRARLLPKRNGEIANMFRYLNLGSFETVRAIHCYWAYSCSICFKLGNGDTFRLSYSGDTRPNPKFASAGYNSDLLIHEASLDDQLIEEAIGKKHSTMSEALAVSRLMNCPKVVLTHFSTRYSCSESAQFADLSMHQNSDELEQYLKISQSAPDIFTTLKSVDFPVKTIDDLRIAFAYDMMMVRYNSIGVKSLLYGNISKLFIKEEEPQEEKKAREAMKRLEKRDQLRVARLSLTTGQKKRRVSNEDDSSNS